MLELWQSYLILSVFASLVFFQCYKLAVAHAKNDGAATIIIQGIAGIAMIAIIPFFDLMLPANPRVYIFFVLACIFYAVSDRLQTTVRKHMEVSAFSILGQSSNVFLLIFGFFLFREPILLHKVGGAILIIGANILLQYRKTRFEWNRYVGFTILGALSLAIALSIDIDNAKHFTLPVYIAGTFLIPALIIKIGERISFTLIKQEIQHLNMKFALITGLAWSATIYFLLRAYQTGSVTTIVPLQATTVLWNVLIASILFHERSHLLQKILAAILVILGIILTL